MFDVLSDKLQAALSDVRARGKLNEDDVSKAMREIRLALLEADVNFKVVKQFTNAVKERALGHEVLDSLNPGQQVVKVVNEELTKLMGESSRQITLSPTPPTVILMAGLQGSGKTTACGKLARMLKEDGKDVALAACDVYRPAAVDQLVKVGAQAGATVYEQGIDRDPRDIAAWAVDQAKRDGRDVVIVDTSGRLHIDQDLMKELADIKKRTKPHNVLLVVDAMTGQDAVNVAEQFSEVAEFDGVVMTKLDGDARGGAALSIKAVTGKPILYASTGEKLAEFEPFHPTAWPRGFSAWATCCRSSRRPRRRSTPTARPSSSARSASRSSGCDDFLDQMKQVRRMGPISGLLGMLPGFGQMKQLKNAKVDERELDRIEAIVTSMTLAERRNPKIIDGSRRKRIAIGSGTSVQAVNQLVKQFAQMQKMMRALQQGKMPSMEQLMRGGM